MMTRRIAIAVTAVIVAAGAGCSDEADGQPQGGMPGMGRGGMSVTLATTDVAEARIAPMEAGLAITGDLRPIETVAVNARLEGEVTDVYVREGQPVRAGQLLARFEAVEEAGDQASAQADLAAARSDLSTAEWNLEQTRDLFKEGAVPERDVRAAQQQMMAARARVAGAEARLRTTANQVRDTRVVAPLSGMIATRQVAPGEHVNRGAPLFTVVRTDVLELAAAVPARVAGELQPGQKVRFNAAGRTFGGTIARVSPTVSAASRAITVYAQVPNPNGLLKGGTFASGRVVTRTVDSALVVPSTAIRQSADGGAPFVWKIDNEMLAKTDVSLGTVDETAGIAEILSGLRPGDKVVVGNVGLLGEGMKVMVLGTEGMRGGRGGKGGPADGASRSGTAGGAPRAGAVGARPAPGQ